MIRLYIFSMILAAMFTTVCTAQSDEVTMKAAFMERFTRFIEWPEDAVSDQDDNFCIMILGENPFGDAMEVLFSTIKIKGMDVNIKYSQDLEDIQHCQMVYISPSLTDDLDEVLKVSSPLPVLTIGDTEGYCDRGVMINFFIDEDVLRFELNLKSFEHSDLGVSHLLINIAKVKSHD